jgi:hypothetical protein
MELRFPEEVAGARQQVRLQLAPPTPTVHTYLHAEETGTSKPTKNLAYLTMATSFLPPLLLSLLALTLPAKAAETPFQGYPSPWINPSSISDPSWADAYAKAVAFVSDLTLTEKVNLTTGTGWQADRCIGNTGGVPRLGFGGMCLMDGPLGVRYSMSVHFSQSFHAPADATVVM